MQVSYRKKFLKQLAKLPAEIRPTIEQFVFETLPTHTSLAEIGKIEKMQGYDGYYKIRFGSYRVGIKQESDESITVQIVMHRRDIYRYFP
ncbi:type II toxin-antitoxin system RelE/ParE family toxin [Candidatus Albibeggiatoa sp. nov. BB20]|uniref:type II toxin-antitoxin system RelE family toxin n=1 Tax=Candidatus Albibeggiatoa sp. nov. BB20 TaxID=3162723 RepID=UPI003365A4D1